ncbi:hypothetical protein C8Q76DRAFT_171886 [Earliella scabrosa]|nr:hypothetical protein C8Q76DRAFT_171886 [Earliella scabrosa]
MCYYFTVLSGGVINCAARCTGRKWCGASNTEPSTVTKLRIQAMGYPMMMALSKAIDDWLMIYRYNLEIIANAAAFANGGPEHILASPKVLVIHLRMNALRPSTSEGNPSFLLMVEGIYLLDKEQGGILMSGNRWEQLEASRQLRTDVSGAPIPPHSAGILPAVAVLALRQDMDVLNPASQHNLVHSHDITVIDDPLSHHQHYPIYYRRRTNHPPGSIIHARTRTAVCHCHGVHQHRLWPLL